MIIKRNYRSIGIAWRIFEDTKFPLNFIIVVHFWYYTFFWEKSIGKK